MDPILPVNNLFDEIVDDASSGAAAKILPVPPIDYDKTTGALSVASATVTRAGIVDNGQQSFSGAKTFAVPPISLQNPQQPSELATKGYVDSMTRTNVQFSGTIQGFTNFGNPPVNPKDGDRYISESDDNAFKKGYIYTWNQALSGWAETAPTEGMSFYSIDNDQTVIYGDNHQWSNLAISIDHQQLIGCGKHTHQELDAMLDILGTKPKLPCLDIMNSTNGSAPSIGEPKGALAIPTGGIGCAKDIATRGGLLAQTLNLADMSDAIDAKTGCAIFAGGIGVSGTIYSSKAIKAPTLALTSSNTYSALLKADASGNVVPAVAGADYALPGGSASTVSKLQVTDTSAASDAQTGCAVFAGGIGVAGVYSSKRITASYLTLTSPNIYSTLLKADATGRVCPAVAGADYAMPGGIVPIQAQDINILFPYTATSPNSLSITLSGHLLRVHTMVFLTLTATSGNRIHDSEGEP